MKIAVISPSPAHLESLCTALSARGHAAAAFEGGKSRVREIAEREAPDLMLVDGICCDPAELAQVEHVTTHHPHTAVVLLCSTTSPDFLIHSMRAGVREVLPSPVPPAALVAAVERVQAKRSGTAARRQGQVLAFMPCKGGSGATFLATNLASQLAETRPVLLIDLNLQFGDALSYVHDGRPPATLADVCKEIHRLDATLLAASTVKVAPNFSILPAPDDLGQAVEIRPEHLDALLALAAAHYDFVLLDMGRALDTLAIQALDRSSRIYLVMQSALPDLRHAAKLLDAFRTIGYGADRTELILNRFERSGEIGLDQVQRALGAVRLHTVHNAWREVHAAINHGEPLARAARAGAVARQLAELALALSPRQDAGRGLLGRLLRRT